MGYNFSMNCQLVENDEELINTILKSTNLCEIDCTTAYRKYLTCLIPSTSHLEHGEYLKFVYAILGNSKYKLYQERFFTSLRDEFGDETIIGTIVIFLSKGGKETKIELLIKHYNSNAAMIDLEHFIKNIIKVNTIHCLNAFQDCIDKGNFQLLNNIYSDYRLEYLCKWIMNNYDEINNKSNNKERMTKSYEEIVRSSLKSYNSYSYNDHTNLFKDFNYKSNENILKEFFEIVYEELEGEFIRNWLYEDFLKEKPKIRVPCE